ncbi:MAG: cysteine--tRNA ligase [Collinsella sp.]
MYVCGPTVYDNIHIGNARTFISFDVIRRWLIASGYEVTFAQNLTDVDDKIINRANEQGRTAEEVATEFSDKFIGVMRAANVLDPDVRPRATKEIGAMIGMIKTLIEGGHAYAADNGDVYFSVRSDPSYGEVSGRNIDDLMVGARIEENEDKRDPLDFALWKAAKPGEPSWKSPWGEGPSRMAHRVRRHGATAIWARPIDIHGGGSDLAFPHHENECAQATCAWHEGFANTWMHTGMLLVDGEKMSKSLGNFFTLAEVLEKHSAAALRLLMLQTHYRSPLDFPLSASRAPRTRSRASPARSATSSGRPTMWKASRAPSSPRSLTAAMERGGRRLRGLHGRRLQHCRCHRRVLPAGDRGEQVP